MVFRFPISVFALALLPVVSLAGSFHLGYVPEDGIGDAKLKVREFLPKDIGQPFEVRDLQQMRTLDDVARYRVQGFWNRYLTFLDLVMLKDYLDFDSIPTSFVVPSVETCPMVCSVSLSADRFAVKKTQTEQSQRYGERVVETTYAIDSSMFNSMSVSAQVVFPFRYAASLRQHNYKCQCIVKFFLAGNYDTSLRAGYINEENELSATKDWKGYWTEMSDRTITFLSQTESISLPDSDELTTDNMTKRVTFDGFSPPHATHERPLLKVARRYAVDSTGHSSSTPIETQYQVGFFPYDTNWNYALSSWQYPSGQEPSYGGWFRPSYAVWVRVMDQYGKTVDVVPATYLDDGIDSPRSSALDMMLTNLCGDHLPLLRFVSDGEFSYAESEFERMTSTGSGGFRISSYAVVDPRYNHAPENWIGASYSYSSRYGNENWYDTIKRILGEYGCDPDPFMFTSDHGYLQSVFELCNLPIAGGLDGASTGDLFDETPQRFDGRVRERIEDIADYEYVWKTYSLPGDSDYDKVLLTDRLEVTDDCCIHGGISDIGGIPSVEAAVRLLENTPCDWFVAGTNSYDRHPLTTLDFLQNSFSPSYGRRELDERTLEEIAAKIASTVNDAFAKDDGNWLEAYDSLDWLSPSDPRRIIGVNLSAPLMTAERKFLHSYWRGLLLSWQLGPYDLILPDDVHEVTEREFANDEALRSVTFSENLWSVRREAFRGCCNLETVTINSFSISIDHDAFGDCPKLSTLVLGPDVNRAPLDAFRYCGNLTNVCVSAAGRHMPNGIEMWGQEHSGTLNLTILADATVVPERFWNGFFHRENWRVVFEEGIERIGLSAFDGDSQIKELIFPSTLKEIGERAFYRCSGVQSIAISAAVTNIEKLAFHEIDVSKIAVDEQSKYYCVEGGVLYGLREGVKRRILQASENLAADYKIPDTIREIDPMAFSGCRNLTSLTIPLGVYELCENTFQGCSGLRHLSIPASVYKIHANAFVGMAFDLIEFEEGSHFYVSDEVLYYKYYDGRHRLVCAKIRDVKKFTLPDAVSSIQDYAFGSPAVLKEFVCGAGLESIGSYAFRNCRGLDSVRFNEGLKEIADGAFEGCSSMRAVIFPTTLDRLGTWAFRSCAQIGKAVFNGDVPDGLADSDLFDSGCQVWYPRSYASAFEEVVPPAQFAGYTDDLLFASREGLCEAFAGFPGVVDSIKTEDEVLGFGAFLSGCGVTTVDELTVGQKTWAYQSFKQSVVVTVPQLFEEEPVLKIDDIELTSGNLSLTISLTTGEEAIQLAKDKLAEKIRVGTTLDDITGKPTIVTSPAADGTSLTFTITPPEGDQGFVRVLLD